MSPVSQVQVAHNGQEAGWGIGPQGITEVSTWGHVFASMGRVEIASGQETAYLRVPREGVYVWEEEVWCTSCSLQRQ